MQGNGYDECICRVRNSIDVFGRGIFKPLLIGFDKAGETGQS